MTTSSLRGLPSVDRLLRQPRVALLAERYSRGQVLDGARELLEEWREQALRNGPTGASHVPSLSELAEELARRMERAARPSLRRVINATGVVIHTNLGRAPLSAAALSAIQTIGSGYSNLEYELEAGQRGSRHEHLSAALRRLTGAEAGLVVNNNAAAVLLVLSSLALEREVVISRGQLVEIGGGFRIPDVLRQSGARLVEVGTTNRTYADDYRRAVGPDTALLLRVHSSNFRVIGFVHEASIRELANVAHDHGLVLVDDLGSGSLLDTSAFGLAREPMVQQSVAEGADLVCFSGDKLLGGPQCGLIVGRAELVTELKRHPLTRAIRPDKLTLAALGATLDHYLRGEAVERVPVWRMLASSVDAVDERARALVRQLGGTGLSFELLDGASAIGGGSLPGETLPTRLLAIVGSDPADRLAARLRAAEPPIIGRIEHDRFVLDLRTVLPEEDMLLAEALARELPVSSRSTVLNPDSGLGTRDSVL
jgi:L-seryl-tRNA(Ser) seleniumtransferase